jgi:hypothetical protein
MKSIKFLLPRQCRRLLIASRSAASSARGRVGVPFDPVGGGVAWPRRSCSARSIRKRSRQAIEKATKSVKETTDRMQQALDQAIVESKRLETITGQDERRAQDGERARQKVAGRAQNVMDRVLEVEQKIAKRIGGGDPNAEGKSWGQRVAESEQYKAARRGRKKNMDPSRSARSTRRRS